MANHLRLVPRNRFGSDGRVFSKIESARNLSRRETTITPLSTTGLLDGKRMRLKMGRSEFRPKWKVSPFRMRGFVHSHNKRFSIAPGVSAADPRAPRCGEALFLPNSLDVCRRSGGCRNRAQPSSGNALFVGKERPAAKLILTTGVIGNWSPREFVTSRGDEGQAPARIVAPAGKIPEIDARVWARKKNESRARRCPRRGWNFGAPLLIVNLPGRCPRTRGRWNRGIARQRCCGTAARNAPWKCLRAGVSAGW